MFLGRVDHQVKIRGHRVEPGEIEEVIRRHPAVREAAVTAPEDAHGGRRLVAYVVPVAEPTLATAELRSFLGRALPDPLIPSLFVVLNDLPLTPNGKVDRVTLTRRDLPTAKRSEKIVLPRSAIEEMVADIFAGSLEVERVGVTDDFFELGGHSLAATRAMLRIRQALGIDVPLRRLFEKPTAAGLASWIEKAAQAEDRIEVPPLERVSSNGESLALSFAQRRLWILDQLAPGSSSYNMSLRLRLGGDLDRGALARAFSEIVRRHQILRTVFPERETGPDPQVLPEGVVGLTTVDLTAVSFFDRQQEAWRQTVAEQRRPFDLSSRVARFVLLRLTESDHWLLITLHHIVTDAESFLILREELTSLYRASVEGSRSTLDELPFQYTDFAHWQNRWLQGEALESQLSYWRRQLRGAARHLRLPTDHPRPPVQSPWGRRLPFRWPAPLSAALRRLSRSSGVTLFMTMVAGFACLLRFLTRQDDIVMGTNVSNRGFAETENLIGLFLNQLVLRVELARSRTFRELQEGVREVVLEAHRHKDLPFERLVEELRPRRDASRALLYQAKIDVLPETPPAAFDLPGLDVGPLELEDPIVRYDLHLTVIDARPELRGFLLYDSDLFDHGSVARFSARLETLLERAASDPEVHLEDLDRRLYEDERKAAGHQEEKLRLELGTLAKQKLRRARRVAVEA
jgi:acyl carrier protein